MPSTVLEVNVVTGQLSVPVTAGEVGGACAAAKTSQQAIIVERRMKWIGPDDILCMDVLVGL